MSKTQIVAKPKTAPVQPTATAPKVQTVYRFEQTPGGIALRAFFLALIMMQTGTLKAGAVFRLWAGINIAGHVSGKRIERKGDGYALTVAGCNFFSDPAARLFADAEAIEKMTVAIRTGKCTYSGFENQAMVKFTIPA